MKYLGFLVLLASLQVLAAPAPTTISSLVPAKGKVLIVLSSQAQLGESKVRTGIWLPNAVHPYIALLNAGYDVDFASPAGGAVPIEAKSDPLNEKSLTAGDFLTRGFVSEKRMMEKLSNTLPLAQVHANDYKGILISGGMAAMYDLPNNPELPRVIKEFWDQNKVISALHYGVYAFLKMNAAGGKEVLRGVELTSVSKDEEIQFAKMLGWDPALTAPKGFLQELIKKEHAGYKAGAPFSSFVTVGAEGHFVTGQQSFSGLELGVRLAKILDKPLKPYVPKTERYLLQKAVQNTFTP
jgi:putative intracellular protease/amidase